MDLPLEKVSKITSASLTISIIKQNVFNFRHIFPHKIFSANFDGLMKFFYICFALVNKPPFWIIRQALRMRWLRVIIQLTNQKPQFAIMCIYTCYYHGKITGCWLVQIGACNCFTKTNKMAEGKMADTYLNAKELKAKWLNEIQKSTNFEASENMMLILRIVLHKNWIKRFRNFTLKCVILSSQW